MIGADVAGLEAGLGSNDHGCPGPGPRAGVKAREATRVAGLALTPSTDQARVRVNLDENARRRRSGAVLEAPAFVAGLDDVAVVREAVQQGRSHFGISENARPFAKGEIGGDDERGAFVEPADKVEE